ncbi:MAG TPA: hypothetical protein VKP68_12680 [Ramlibacter sp.]|nr:hypothetical protein [Ramlibacter sp.]
MDARANQPIGDRAIEHDRQGFPTARFMSNLEHNHGAVPDDKLAGLVRAVAAELIELGFRPAAEPGHLLRDGEPVRVIDRQVWDAINELLAGREP